MKLPNIQVCSGKGVTFDQTKIMKMCFSVSYGALRKELAHGNFLRCCTSHAQSATLFSLLAYVCDMYAFSEK